MLTPIVTFLAFALLLRSQRLTILHASPLAPLVSALGLIYFIEIFNPLQGSLFAGFAGALFMLVPLIWFFFGQSVEEEFIVKALRLTVVLGIFTSLYGVYQLLFGYPAFEQYWINNTEFYESIAVGHILRALATFSSAEEWGRYTEVGAIAAFGFAASAKRIRVRAGYLLCGAALFAFVVLTGQRTAVFGLLFGLAVLVLLGARSFRGAVARLLLFLAGILLVTTFIKPPAEDDIWEKNENEAFSTVLLHTERGTLKPTSEESFQVRLENWAFLATHVIPYRPLGAGIGAGNLGQRRFTADSDYNLPPLDSSIVQIAIACGLPGLLLFLWVVGRATWVSLRNARTLPTDHSSTTVRRIVAAILCALVLNSVFGLTFTIYSVAPIAWLLIGWTSARMKAAPLETERETITI